MSTAGGKSDGERAGESHRERESEHDLAGTTHRERQLLARLDRAFAHQRAALTPAQLRAVETWQRSDRTYELVQAIARGEVETRYLGPAALRQTGELRRKLTAAIQTAVLPFPVAVYRGIRSLAGTFGVAQADLLQGHAFWLDGYVATSVLRTVALREFTAPAGALMELSIPAGAPALWVAGVGSSRLRRQGELLLPEGMQICVRSHRREADLPVLSVEVIRS